MSQTFEEWRQTLHKDFWGNPEAAMKAAWDFKDAELKAAVAAMQREAAAMMESFAVQHLTRLPIDERDALNCRQYAKAILALPADQSALERVVRDALEDERTTIAKNVIAIDKTLHAYEWLIVGRGSYQWDDDRWHEEFSYACANIKKELEPLRKIGADLSNRAAAGAPIPKDVK